MSTTQFDDQIDRYSKMATRLIDEVGRVLVGQDAMITHILTGLLTGGHVLIEGVPGLAKTLAVSSLAKAVNTSFSRIQFTPDMLPADVIGTEVFNPKEATYHVKKGPVFANLILADEINRAPAKVQAALLEAMQERQVTIGTETYSFEEPFLVMATQNPIEQEGTYPLPEAQIDRFMMKILVDYPSREEERKIVNRMAVEKAVPEVTAVATPDELMGARNVINQIWVDDKVRDYAVDLVRASRNPSELGINDMEGFIETGGSPRASIYLLKAGRTHAFLQGRSYVLSLIHI